MRTLKPILYLCVALCLSGCGRRYRITEHTVSYARIDSVQQGDSRITGIILPYKQMLDSQMNVVAGSLLTDLKKARPEGNLGNWMADVARAEATRFLQKPVDIAILNHGGIRIPELRKGPVKVGQLFELMPFENEIIVLELEGETLYLIAELIAKKGGDPISGMAIRVGDDKKVHCTVSGLPLDTSKTYLVATTDYLYNGGDDYGMLRAAVKTWPMNRKLRDLLIESFRSTPQVGYPETEGRIIIE